MNVLEELARIREAVETFEETVSRLEPKAVLIDLLDQLDRCRQEMEGKDIWKRGLSKVEISDACNQLSDLEIETRLLWSSFVSVVPVKLSNVEPFDTRTLSDEMVDRYRKRIRGNTVGPIVVRGHLVDGPLLLLNGRQVVAAAELEGKATLQAVVLRPRVPLK